MISRQHNIHREHFNCFLCSWADDGWGRGACEHFGQLESGGQNYPLHQDTREEEDIWQRQLPVSDRYYPVCVCLWVCALCKWACLNITHHRLLEKIKQTAGITAVFVNVERLSPLSEVSLSSSCLCPHAAYMNDSLYQQPFFIIQRELEEAWGVKVFDRYSVVLRIFRCNARTKEAKLQISLAEIPLLR